MDVEGVLERLAAVGLRPTDQRRAVVEALAVRPGAFTVQEVVDELAPRGIGRATVFRAVNTLETLGYVTRLHVGAECDRYAVCDGSHHHHLVCTLCGNVFPIEQCPVDAAAESAAREIDFAIAGHHVDIYGTCAACRARTPPGE